MNSYYKKQKSIPDFIILLFILLLLVIDFLPYFKSLEIINPQFLYIAVLNFLFGVYLLFNKDRIDPNALFTIKKNYVFRIYALFVFLCGLSIIAAKNTSLVYTKITEILIVFCLFINLSILLKNKLHLLYKIVFIVGLAAFFQSVQQLSSFLIVPKGTSIIELLANMKGNTGNINILAASLTIKVPFLLLGITYFKDLKKLFFLTALFSVTTIIFLTGARTSLINLFLLIIVYGVYLIKENSFAKSTIIKIVFTILPILIAFFYSNSIFQKSKNKERYASIENRLTQINTSDASAQARLAYWHNALEISKKNPVLGIGLGNYQVESIPYEKTTAGDFLVSLHAHNDFLEILAETGIVNALIYLSLFIFITIINIKNIFKSDDLNVRTIAVLTLLVTIVYGLDSLFNFPMYRPTMQIFFALLLSFTILNNSSLINIESKPESKSIKIIAIILIGVSLATSYSAFLIYKASNLEYLIATDDINMNDKGYLNGDEVIRRIPKYPNVFSTSESFYEYAAIYYIREKKYDRALNCFSKASKINAYSGRIDFYKYIMASQRGKIDSAYIYAKQAFYLRPRNFTLYTASTRMAGNKKDTLEILKEHKIHTTYIKSPSAWIVAAYALQQSGASQKNIISFINQGLKETPNSNELLKQKNSLLITDYIIKGQAFEAKLKLNEALESYKKALKIDPINVYVMQNIGFYYYKFGQYKLAIPYLINALKYPGLEDGKTEYFLGFCYKGINDERNFCKYINLSKAKKYSSALGMNAICK